MRILFCALLLLTVALPARAGDPCKRFKPSADPFATHSLERRAELMIHPRAEGPGQFVYQTFRFTTGGSEPARLIVDFVALGVHEFPLSQGTPVRLVLADGEALDLVVREGALPTTMATYTVYTVWPDVVLRPASELDGWDVLAHREVVAIRVGDGAEPLLVQHLRGSGRWLGRQAVCLQTDIEA